MPPLSGQVSNEKKDIKQTILLTFDHSSELNTDWTSKFTTKLKICLKTQYYLWSLRPLTLSVVLLFHGLGQLCLKGKQCHPLFMVKLTICDQRLFDTFQGVICTGIFDGVCQNKVLLKLSTKTKIVLPIFPVLKFTTKIIPTIIPVLIFTTKIILPIIPVVGFERSSWIVQGRTCSSTRIT